MESWLAEQSNRIVLSWEKSIEQFYPQYLEIWTNPTRHLEALIEEWNLFTAAEYLDWDKYLVGHALKIIDLGTGTGWLSIVLSKRQNVEKIYALDSSPNNLDVMLPAIAELMQGNLAKIQPILGLFTPILVDDNYFDVAVASSAVHHAPDLAELLTEVYRVIKPGGFFLMLNEQPIPSWRYTMITLYRCAKILRTVTLRRWQPIAKPISENSIMIDPFLGDRAYCHWQWQRAIQAAGFSFQAVKTPYPVYKNIKRRQSIRLTHFIAQKPVNQPN